MWFQNRRMKWRHSSKADNKVGQIPGDSLLNVDERSTSDDNEYDDDDDDDGVIDVVMD